MLLEQAARCRRLARICSTASIARKFEALARDYEEHARLRNSSHAEGIREADVPLPPGTARLARDASPSNL
jgi:hypothetical protein